MDEKRQFDLAHDSFIGKWPAWLRWILFLPASIVVPFLFYAFQMLMQTWFLDIGPDAFLLVLMRGVIYGGGFIIVGSFVAPNHQRVVALVLMIILAMLVGVDIFAIFLLKYPITKAIESLIMLVTAGYSTNYIFKELNKI